MQHVRTETRGEKGALSDACRKFEADGCTLDDLEHLRSPVEVSLGTGVRKITELLQLRIENVNFSSLSIFRPANGRDVEVRPNWFLLVNTKGKGPASSLDADERSCTSSVT